MEIQVSKIEQQIILTKLKKCFKYSGDYWIPLKNVSIDKEYYVVSDSIALNNASKIEAFIKTLSETFYLTGELGYFEPHSPWLIEVDNLDLNYGPVEFVYFDKNFDWLIYISHENTVTFCGEQLAKFIKEIYS